MQDIIEHLNKAINGFNIDPPDSDYQRGYLAALKETRRVVRDLVPAKKIPAR
jgi:hypothetical protein